MHYCIHGKFRQEKISPPALIGKKFIPLIFCPVSTMTALAKNLSMHQNTKVAGLGKIKKFPRTRTQCLRKSYA